MKFSDSFGQEWLNYHASDYAVARRLLTEYHPMEPEMWLQMAGHLFPQSFGSGTITRFIVPVPWQRQTLPKEVVRYMTSTWRRADMPLLEYLHKARKGKADEANGGSDKPLQYLQRRHRRANTDLSLEAWSGI